MSLPALLERALTSVENVDGAGVDVSGFQELYVPSVNVLAIGYVEDTGTGVYGGYASELDVGVGVDVSHEVKVPSVKVRLLVGTGGTS